MKTRNLKIKSNYDDLELGALLCRPEQDPVGIIQIVHGMSEHKERYIPFMEFMCSKGFACIIHDHRGHGESVRSAEDLGYMYSGGSKALTDDILTVNKVAKNEFPDLPCCLLGHSMGSLAVRSFIRKYDNQIDGLIVCGSPSKNPAAGAGKLLAEIFSAIKGERHRPSFIQGIAFDGFNRKFASEGQNAWLCTEKEVVEAYNSNPLCGFTFTANGFKALFELMADTYSDNGWTVCRPELPILFIAGSEDPCIINEKGFKAAAEHMRKNGYKNVRSILYPGMRHEIMNGKDRGKVWKDICEMAASLSCIQESLVLD